MANPRSKKKLAALDKENSEEHPRSNLAQNSNVPRPQEDSITQVSEEIEGRVRKKLFQEFRRTENRILAGLSRLDDFLMNPLIQGHTGTTPETSRNAYGTNQGTKEDDSQSDPHPEAGLLRSQTTRNFGPEDGHDIHYCPVLCVKMTRQIVTKKWNHRKSYRQKIKEQYREILDETIQNTNNIFGRDSITKQQKRSDQNAGEQCQCTTIVIRFPTRLHTGMNETNNVQSRFFLQ